MKKEEQGLLEHILVPINRAGWPFIAIFAAVALALAAFSDVLGTLGALLTIWCVFFFRDPPRVTPLRPGLVVSPADGLVQSVVAAVPPPELGMAERTYTRVSIFMNVFDVHVNRVPIAGRVAATAYRPGKFFNASFDKASEHNERQSILIVTPDGVEVGVVQIAGLVARRIICEVSEGHTVVTGERFGMIRFGSRLDVYLPSETGVQVIEGQRAVAGETVLADLNADEPTRIGEVR